LISGLDFASLLCLLNLLALRLDGLSGVLSGPGPWEYVHCFLPGGTENLGKPEFELRIGTQAPLVGTLMRIMAVRRNEDSTLTLVVQGRARVRVLNQTQSLPYSRADVQVQCQIAPVCVSCPASGRAWFSLLNRALQVAVWERLAASSFCTAMSFSRGLATWAVPARCRDLGAVAASGGRCSRAALARRCGLGMCSG